MLFCANSSGVFAIEKTVQVMADRSAFRNLFYSTNFEGFKKDFLNGNLAGKTRNPLIQPSNILVPAIGSYIPILAR